MFKEGEYCRRRDDIHASQDLIKPIIFFDHHSTISCVCQSAFLATRATFVPCVVDSKHACIFHVESIKPAQVFSVDSAVEKRVDTVKVQVDTDGAH